MKRAAFTPEQEKKGDREKKASISLPSPNLQNSLFFPSLQFLSRVEDPRRGYLRSRHWAVPDFGYSLCLLWEQQLQKHRLLILFRLSIFIPYTSGTNESEDKCLKSRKCGAEILSAIVTFVSLSLSARIGSQ